MKISTKFVLLSIIWVVFLTSCGGSSSSDSAEVPIVNIDEPVISPDTPIPDLPFTETLPVLSPDQQEEQQFDGVVTVTINVEVLESTPVADRLYVTGDFENWSGGGNVAYELAPQADNHYQLSFVVNAGSTLQFKITRGTWLKEESSELGRVVGNRVRRVLSQDATFNEVVPGWIDITPTVENPHAGFWNTPTPNFISNIERPIITLNGPHTQYVELGSSYQELGAVATDNIDGDISTNIQMSGVVDVNQLGDYLVTYQVSDNDNNHAISKTRIVRVTDNDISAAYSLRPVGQSNAHLGYIEQLPADYGKDLTTKYPLLIYHHGGGGDASTLNDSPINSLIRISQGGGPATLAMSDNWNAESPLIALSPQRSNLSPPNFERIDAFVDYAVNNYQIDVNRIYMTGHSQGGFISWRYAVEHPNKVAAIAPLAGGFFAGGIPTNLCDAAVVPIWAFHSSDDNVVSLATGRAPINLIKQCSNGVIEPRFTVFNGLGHQSHQYVLSLQGMGNALNNEDPFNLNLYQWMMQQNIANRP